MPIHTGRLVLAPRDALQVPGLDTLVAGLQTAGFLGPALDQAKVPAVDAYAVGDDFLRLVTFAGCAVQIDLDGGAGAGRPFCHIRIVGPSPRPQAILGGNTRSPRCPACRAPLRDWRDRLILGLAAGELDGYGNDRALSCPSCGTERPAWFWDWKESGGFARLSLWVEEVFPGEAAPTDTLLDLLSELSAIPWRHFYVQDA